MLLYFVSIRRRSVRAEPRNERNVYFQPLNGRLAIDLLRIARGRLVFSHPELLHLRKFLQVRDTNMTYNEICQESNNEADERVLHSLL